LSGGTGHRPFASIEDRVWSTHSDMSGVVSRVAPADRKVARPSEGQRNMAISTLVHGSGIVTKVTMPSMFQPNVGRLFKTAVRERSRSMGGPGNRQALAWFC